MNTNIESSEMEMWEAHFFEIQKAGYEARAVGKNPKGVRKIAEFSYVAHSSKSYWPSCETVSQIKHDLLSRNSLHADAC